MSAGTTLAANAKAVISAVGGVITVLAAAGALFSFAPASVAGPGTALLGVLEVLRTVNVWFVRNEPALEGIATAAGVAYDELAPPRTRAPLFPASTPTGTGAGSGTGTHSSSAQ